MHICCAWVQKRVVITKVRVHGPGRSIPMFKSQVQRPLGYPGAHIWNDLIQSFKGNYHHKKTEGGI